MQTVTIEIEDALYDDIKRKGIDIKKEIERNIKKIVYAKECEMAEEIKGALKDIKAGKTRPLNEWDHSKFCVNRIK